MKPGELVAGRFLLQRLVGEGGSSKVYQAFDRATNDTIALKVLSVKTEPEDQRFRSEARILSELTHPGIVRYVAHGETPAFEPFIAMQWLEGVTLAERLAYGRLSVADSLLIVRRTAEALAEAHERGLVHRDLKPSNLFLLERDPAKLKVLDFGIAKFLTETGWRTGTGTFLGTVGYMAPEQTAAARDVDARADVFALGCVFLECLTGRAAFVADHPVALLAKVLTEPSPRLADIDPSFRGPLDELVARMLAKDPSGRPADAAAVLCELDALPEVVGGPPSQLPLSAPGALTGVERRVISVALVRSGGAVADPSIREPMHTLADEYGADVTLLSNGTFLLVLSGRGTAVDRAARAAACTLAVRRLRPEASIALSTGWADATFRAPVGPVIDRAAALLHEAASQTDAARGVAVDTTTARLLAARFEILETPAGPILVGEQHGDDPAPPLLGKVTPCVGREKELTLLVSTFSDCVAERAPRAALVTADAGVGKSRLAREFAAMVRRDGVARVVTAKGDSTGAGAAFLLARQLIRGTAGLADTLTERELHAALVARLSPPLEPKQGGYAADFLCELLGVPVSAEPDSVLAAARGDARLMSEWMRRSFEEWLSVEAATPLVFVLEDLHWGDAPTVTYLGDALFRRDLPLMVLALARREVRDVFPNLWSAAHLEQMGLSGLGRRAAEELVRAVLPGAAAETIRRVVERANGNAFYLEELIRAVAEGRGDALPETVVAMAHAGLERLDPRSRRVLRAASVFGQRFGAAGVGAIVGDDFTVTESLRVLEEREVVTRVRGAPGEAERPYAFRHALLRDAAYETFTDTDRAAAHVLAVDWLERTGGADPVVMADHLESGGAAARAVPYLVRATERAYAAGSPTDARRFAARGMPHAAGEELGTLELLDGASALLQGDYRTAVERIGHAAPLLERASDRWLLGVSTLAYANTVAGASSAAVEFVDAIQGLPVLPMHNPLCAFGVARGILALSFAGEVHRARALIDRVDAEGHPELLNPSSKGWVHLARGFSFMAGARPMPVSVAHARTAVELLREAQDELAIPSALCWLAVTRACVGDYRTSATVQGEAIARAAAGGNLISQFLMKPLFELARALAGEPESALEEIEKGFAQKNPLGDSVMLFARGYVLFLLGRLGEAEAVSRQAVRVGIPITVHSATATLARLSLLAGRAEEALELATRCIDGRLSDPFSLSSDAPLVRAEALHALGRTDRARAALEQVHRDVLETAAALSEADRATYLGAVRSSARALELRESWVRATT